MSDDGFVQTPRATRYNVARETVTLLFDEDASAKAGEFVVRGGICWPVPMGDIIRGAVLVGAKDIETGKLIIFGERLFSTVDTVISGRASYPGCASFFAKARSLFYPSRYYYAQSDHTHKNWLRQVRLSPLAQPCPSFADVHWDNTADAEAIVSDLLARDLLVYQDGGPVHQAMNEYRAKPAAAGTLPPAYHALAAMCLGFQRSQWRGADKPYDFEP